jgi:hypothetical protein
LQRNRCSRSRLSSQQFLVYQWGRVDIYQETVSNSLNLPMGSSGLFLE